MKQRDFTQSQKQEPGQYQKIISNTDVLSGIGNQIWWWTVITQNQVGNEHHKDSNDI